MRNFHSAPRLAATFSSQHNRFNHHDHPPPFALARPDVYLGLEVSNRLPAIRPLKNTKSSLILSTMKRVEGY